jgi:hypothetical protein
MEVVKPLLGCLEAWGGLGRRVLRNKGAMIGPLMGRHGMMMMMGVENPQSVKAPDIDAEFRVITPPMRSL